MAESICEVVRALEREYVSGTVQKSKYVSFSMFEIISTTDAYLNSKHLSGEYDDLGREKPFFNISVAAANIWWRATDLDTRNIKLRASKTKDYIGAFLKTVLLQQWMKDEKFGVYLNKWGQLLAQYGSAVTKIFENSKGLHVRAMSWTKMIVDPVEFAPNPKIEILELTPAQLMKRVKTHNYNATAVKGLLEAVTKRQTQNKQTKDNRPGYIRIYETHGEFSEEQYKISKGITDMTESDASDFSQQIHVVSYVGTKSGRKTEYEDFELFAGKEAYDPFRLDSLIEDMDRSLGKGAVEYICEAQWMTNHSIKTEKDTLDLASRLFFQTSDGNFLNMNIIDNAESGDILVHADQKPLSQVNTSKYDITNMMNFRAAWKGQSQEIAGISEAMLGILPKSGTPAAQTQQILQENYSLFETMTENKGLSLTEMLRDRILPSLDKKMDSSEEVSAILSAHDIEKIDAIFLNEEATKRANKQVMAAINENLDRMARGENVQPIDAAGMHDQHMALLQAGQQQLGNTRYFKPSEMDDTTWNDQLAGIDTDIDIDITGEGADVRGMLAVLADTLKMIMTPGFEQNAKAQAVARRSLELSGAMSPVEYDALPDAPEPTVTPTAPQQVAPTQSTVGA